MVSGGGGGPGIGGSGVDPGRVTPLRLVVSGGSPGDSAGVLVFAFVVGVDGAVGDGDDDDGRSGGDGVQGVLMMFVVVILLMVAV